MSNHAGDAPFLELRLSERRKEADGILSFELVHPDGEQLPAFDAGAHILVDIVPGVSRAYSLCNDPAERHRYVIAVLRTEDSRGGSVGMHQAIEPGQLVRVSAPRNEFELVQSAGRSLLFAGGIGITPLLSMAETLANADREFELHYCTRDAAKTAFTSRIETRFSKQARIYHDLASKEQPFDARKVLKQGGSDDHVYACGPSGFIEHILSTAAELGWEKRQLHREFFGSPTTQNDGSAETAFDLILASSGKKVHVPCGVSAATALLEAGISLSMSCEQGICGTCVTTVLNGMPDHRDHYLTDDDRSRNDCFMPCCSRSLTAELLVDL
ncbi:PDR/VanB family oxidoreductase [Cupriavidus metallidurans]|nr:PDR/VanB family oxidoreductase [Cupriavidus metallidurans]QGS32394.1 2Fe-2S iron-sulfur cluster binding domain-containing protein [Cupriavidus metallidurans]